MSHTDIEIASKALVRIGARPISDFESNSTESAVAGDIYYEVLDGYLTERNWPFANGQIDLGAVLEAEPVANWSYAFQLPTNPPVLAIRRITRSGVDIIYERHEDKIYTEEDADLQMDYTFRPVAGNFPAYFVEALINRLGTSFAIAIPRNLELANAMNTIEEHRTANGGAVASQEHTTKRIHATRLTGRRRS